MLRSRPMLALAALVVVLTGSAACSHPRLGEDFEAQQAETRDAELAAAVTREFFRRGLEDWQRIEVRADAAAGRVELAGLFGDEGTRARARELALAVPGVRELHFGDRAGP